MEAFICSLCCGETREQEKCAGCSFFKPVAASRNYRDVPYFSTEEMAASLELERIAEHIETALCQAWSADGANVNDGTAARLLELMMDTYHFNNEAPSIDEPSLAAGNQLLSRTVRDELGHVPADQLVKVLAAVYRSIQRRTTGGSNYLEFISRFTGVRPGR